MQVPSINSIWNKLPDYKTVSMIAGATAGYTLLAGLLSEKCLENTNPIREFLCDTNEKDSINESMPNVALIAGVLIVICSASATYGAIKNTYIWIKS